MTLLGRQVAGLLLAATGLVLATSAGVMLVQPVLTPQSGPDTQAAPPHAPPGSRVDPPATGDLPNEAGNPPADPPATEDRPDEAVSAPPAPHQAEKSDDVQVLDDVQVSDDGPVTFSDIPRSSTGIPSDAQDDPQIVETPDIVVTPVIADTSDAVVTDTSDVVVADDSDVVVTDDTPSDDTPDEATPRQPRPSAPDPRVTNRRAGSPDVAARPDRRTFPAGWPWHQRLGNQGNGTGHGPPAGAR